MDRLVEDMGIVEDWGLLTRRFRVLHGLTQKGLGDMFSVSQRTVSRWERNENKPSPECQRRLRDLGREAPGALWDSSVAPTGPASAPGAPSSAQGRQAGRDDTLQDPTAIAARVIALLDHLSPEDVSRLPAKERRRLADQCRQVALLAEPGSGAPPKPGRPARSQQGQNKSAPLRKRGAARGDRR
jgi:transcriptional regulator with XRE-family HTH domain